MLNKLLLAASIAATVSFAAIAPRTATAAPVLTSSATATTHIAVGEPNGTSSAITICMPAFTNPQWNYECHVYRYVDGQGYTAWYTYFSNTDHTSF